MDAEMKAAIDKAVKSVPEKDRQSYTKLLTKVFEEGVLPQDAMEISDAFLEMVYAQAYQLFQSGKFEQAETAYKYLIGIRPHDMSYALALAACYHKMKNYKNALFLYATTASLSPNDPMPLYHAADCFLKLDDPVSAIRLLQEVMTKSDTPEYITLKEKAARWMDQLKELPTRRPDAK